MSTPPLTYDNRTGRGPGRTTRALGLVLPGIARVRAQAEPYADEWHQRNLEALAGRGRRWVVLGDSMSQGVGASSPDRGWVGQLAERLADDGHRLDIVNLSATGARVTDVLDQQLPALAGLPAAGDRGDPVDLVTLLIGSNDLFAGRRARTALPDGFAELVARVPDGTVVATLPQPRAAARSANEHVRAAEAAGRVRVVDMAESGPASWRGRLADDWFHPNDLGYAAIADAFEPAVRRALTASG